MNDTYNRISVPARTEEASKVLSWMVLEDVYAHNKFKGQRAEQDELLKEGVNSFWSRQIVQYLDRARLFLDAADGATEPAKTILEKKGQQAILKCMMTAKGMAESCVRVYGNPPAPGVPTGEIGEWD